MNDEEHRRIIIRRISGYDQHGGGANGNPSPTPINRWVALAILIPALAALAVLGVFFFTIFVALFSIIAVVIGARIWWLRRKFRKAMQEGGMQDGQSFEYTAYREHEKSDQHDRHGRVEDAEIIEETTIIRESKKKSDDNKQ